MILFSISHHIIVETHDIIFIIKFCREGKKCSPKDCIYCAFCHISWALEKDKINWKKIIKHLKMALDLLSVINFAQQVPQKWHRNIA